MVSNIQSQSESSSTDSTNNSSLRHSTPEANIELISVAMDSSKATVERSATTTTLTRDPQSPTNRNELVINSIGAKPTLNVIEVLSHSTHTDNRLVNNDRFHVRNRSPAHRNLYYESLDRHRDQKQSKVDSKSELQTQDSTQSAKQLLSPQLVCHRLYSTHRTNQSQSRTVRQYASGRGLRHD